MEDVNVKGLEQYDVELEVGPDPNEGKVFEVSTDRVQYPVNKHAFLSDSLTTEERRLILSGDEHFDFGFDNVNSIDSLHLVSDEGLEHTITISPVEDKSGWETDSTDTGYGLPYWAANAIAHAVNEYIKVNGPLKKEDFE